jgi:hypothetical protein
MASLLRGAYLGDLRRVSAVTLACLALTGSCRTVEAQTTPSQSAPDGTYTLHVYTDLLQLPTVVLTRLHSNYRSLTKQSFMLSLNGGPAFHPTNVRLEGDDPVTLAVIFDLSTDDSPMFQSFAQAMTTLPAGVFSQRDYLSVYAYDCELIRATEDQPATPEHLRESMVKVLTEGRESAHNGAKESCSPKKRLYDVVARVAEDIGKLPGRRVILVISDGADRRSVNDWLAVSRYADDRSVAVFGMRPLQTASGAGRSRSGSTYDDAWVMTEASDPFGSLCGSTGGLVLDAYGSKKFMAGQIQRLMTILRDRYIIEFRRPANGSVGYYAIDVKIGDPSAIIRPAGVGFPPRERDPQGPEGTLPTDTSQMPLVGPKQQDAPPK